MDIKIEFEKKINKITNEKNIISFLEDLSKEDKKSLVPLIKKLYKYYTETLAGKTINGYTRYAQRGSGEQISALTYTGYFCMNQKDFTRTFWGFRDEYFFSTELHDIYSPTWFSDYVNNVDSIFSLNYTSLIKLYQAGYLMPGKNLIVRYLPNIIFRRPQSGNLNKYQYRLDDLYIDPITLKEHIWYLFSEESNINWSDRWIHLNGEEGNWKTAFSTLIENGDLDRLRVLKECLKCANRNYNKTLTGWYFDLLLHLKPSVKELITLQEDLFLVFNSLHSKPINVCLKYIKTICTNADFSQEGFVENVTILLSSEVKVIVNSTLMILDKIAKGNKKLQTQICILVTDAFLHKDERIQVRVAKLLNKYGDSESVELSENIMMYHADLFTSAKQILTKFDFSQTDEEDGLEETIDCERELKVKEENRIQNIETFEEMIFFFAQVFDNNEDYHFDLYLELLPKFYQMINESNFHQLEPVYQRATSTINAWNQKIGYLEKYMAITFCNVMSLLIKKYPNQQKINALHKGVLDQKVYVNTVNKKHKYIPLLNLIEDQRVGDNYSPFTRRLTFVRSLCEQNIVLPLLSTPTHIPCWLTIETLIGKLKIYQQKNQIINLYDFQIAINRIVVEDDKDYQGIIESTLTGEFKDLLLYFTDKVPLDLKKCKFPSLWLAVVYRKGNQEDLETFFSEFDKNGQSSFIKNKPSWSFQKKEYKNRVYNYEKQKYEHKIVEQKYIRIKDQENKEKNSGRILSKLLPKKKNLNSIYHCFKESSRNTYIRPNDEKKMLFLSPSNPDLIVRLNIKQSLKNINWVDADQERTLSGFTEGLIHVWSDFGEITYLQIACTLLYNKKTCRQLAAELWIQGVSQGKMNNRLLGKCIGQLEFNEYAPLKRLTDLIIDQMINVSKSHNKALETLIIYMLKELNEKPIKGTNKLLQLYVELIQKNKTKVPSELQLKLKTWTSSKALLKTIKLLE